jgi:hypothetical protein
MLSRRELLASAAALPSVRVRPQDAATIKGLIQQLEADDWVDQAKAAKELARIGKPALDALSSTLSEAPSFRYWSDAIFRKAAPAKAPAPAAKAPEPAAPPDSGFNPGDDNVGNLMFVCNNPKHGDYEVVIKFCPSCGKSKRFFYDYEAQPAVYRCSVCRKVTPTTAMKCDKCGQPPGPRTRVRTRR